MHAMDDVDYKIIYELDRNSRASNIEIAQKIGVSEGTVRKRIADMANGGVIEKFTIEFGVKYGLKAFVLIKAVPQWDFQTVRKFLRGVHEVKTFYQTTGDWDMIVRVFTDNSKDFNTVIERIRSQPWVLKTDSLVVLDID